MQRLTLPGGPARKRCLEWRHLTPEIAVSHIAAFVLCQRLSSTQKRAVQQRIVKQLAARANDTLRRATSLQHLVVDA